MDIRTMFCRLCGRETNHWSIGWVKFIRAWRHLWKCLQCDNEREG